MLLLILGLFFHFVKINCDEIEKANFNEHLRTGHEAARSHNFMDSITDIMWNSTPGIDQTTRITPRYSILSTPISHETYLQNPTGQALIGPSFTERFPQANRWNRKITQRKISNRQLKNNAFIDQPRHQLHQRTTVLEISRRRNQVSEAKASFNDLERRPREPALHRIKRSQTVSTATKKRLFPNLLLSDGMATKGDDTNTDEDDEFEKTIPQKKGGERIMRMRKTSKKLWFIDQTETPTAATATQFLRQNTVSHPYFEMIEALQEGYMMVFLIELTRLIATKERKAVRDVVKHTDQIIYGLYKSKQLLWLGKPLIDVTRKVARLLKESEIDVIQNHAANLYHMLSERHQELSVEVNTILEYADMLYDDDEGRLLFDALNEFEAFPNRVLGCVDGTLVTMIRPKEHEERYYCRKGYYARNVLIINDADLNILHVDVTFGGATNDSFVFSNTRVKEHLENLSNEEIVYLLVRLTGYWLCNSLIHNFLRPYRRLKDTQQRQELMESVNLELQSYKKTPLRSGDIRHEDENQPPPQTEPVTQTEPHSDTTRSPRERKRKRHHRSHKRKRERKRRRIHRYRPEYSQRYYQEHILGSVTGRTRVQSRFRVKMKNI